MNFIKRTVIQLIVLTKVPKYETARNRKKIDRDTAQKRRTKLDRNKYYKNRPKVIRINGKIFHRVLECG